MHKCTANIIICRIFMFKNLKRNSMKKISAVEWLLEKLTETHTNYEWKEIIRQAKEMEKQQIIESYCVGCLDITKDENIFPRETSEEYFFKTFKSE